MATTYPQYAEDVVTDFEIAVQSLLVDNGVLHLLDLGIVEAIEPVLYFLREEREEEEKEREKLSNVTLCISIYVWGEPSVLIERCPLFRGSLSEVPLS